MLRVIIGKYNEKKKPLTYVYLVLETASKLFFFPHESGKFGFYMLQCIHRH